MPKTLQGTKKPSFIGQAKVPINGDDMEASDLEVPVQVLLDDAAYLLAELKAITLTLQNHGHSVATADEPGFMSPGDRAAMAGFSEALASHRHTNATPQADGFFPQADKDKLNKIEAGAQAVSTTRVRTALGVKTDRWTIPDSVYGPNEVKKYRRTLQGVTYDDCVLASQYSSGTGLFSVFYHAFENAVEILVRNLSSTSSRTLEPTEVTYMVIKF